MSGSFVAWSRRQAQERRAVEISAYCCTCATRRVNHERTNARLSLLSPGLVFMFLYCRLLAAAYNREWFDAQDAMKYPQLV